MNRIIVLLTTFVLLVSCDSNKKDKYDPYKIAPTTAKKTTSKSSFEIDFKKREDNIKTIHVKFNGTNSYDAIFDTGCSGISISQHELDGLIKNQTIFINDEKEPIRTMIADGTVRYVRVFNIREITVTDKNGQPHTLRDLDATVEDNLLAPILIGSSVIDNLAKKSYTVDLDKRVIRFQ